MAFKVPTSFQLHGQTYTVRLVDHLAQDGISGEIQFATNTVSIQKDNKGYARLPSQIEQTFLHELVHGVLYHMGQTELCGEEEFVDGFAQLLHQAFVSAKYDDGKAVRGKKRG